MSNPIDWDEPGARAFVQGITRSVDANMHLAGLAADNPMIAKVIARADLVYALFPSRAAAYGFDGLIVKGVEVFGGDNDKLLRLQAIPCVSQDAALQLQARYGDSRLGMGRIH